MFMGNRLSVSYFPPRMNSAVEVTIFGQDIGYNSISRVVKCDWI
jgi:hypothetical protein